MAFLGEALLSASFESIISELISPAIKEFITGKGIDKDLKKLRRMLPKIQEVLDDAEQKEISDPFVKEWLKNLTDVAYDIQDIMDELAYEAERSKMEGETETAMNQVWNFFSPNSTNFSLSEQVDGVMERLEEIEEDRKSLGLSEIVGRRWLGKTERLPTTSVIDESKFVGRVDDTNEVIELLLKPSRNNVSVISIVGMGGLGKTTLAQNVFDDKRVKDHFGKKAWVCVSDEFDVRRLTEAILESVNMTTSDFKELNTLQVTLRNKLKEKRFLLILDDVWNEEHKKWDLLRAPLGVGAPGSKILITTRSEKVALITRADSVHHLRVLSEENCYSLFMQCAFPGGNSSEYRHLEVIGKEIVKKCKGLPLTAKTLGGVLYSEVNEDEWKYVLQSEMWDLPVGSSDILPALRLSYHHLPSHLKQCFAYCSIFPKDYLFDKERLVWLWMAQGYVQSKGPKSLGDVGSQYFDDLLSRCFFQQHPNIHLKGYFVMHDLVHDLAHSVSGELNCNVGDNLSSKISPRTRHSSFHFIRSNSEVIANLEALYKVKSLRTIFSLQPYKKIVNWQPPHDFWQKLRYLRVLNLSWTVINEIPDSISNLRQLRYLDFSGTKIKKLPESIGKLFNIQQLRLSICKEFEELPKSVSNLKQLWHLDLSSTAIPMLPESIGSLSNLCKLKLRECNRLDKLPDSIGNLNHLQDIDVSFTLIQMLPESIGSLSNLCILTLRECYRLDKLPDSIGNLNNLQDIDVSCTSIQMLPESIGSLSNLQGLTLDNCKRLELSKSVDGKLFSIPIGIGRLTSLRRLPLFVVSEESWAKLRELKELKKLGELHISGLENVINADEAKDAALKDKQFLRELTLEWGDANGNMRQLRVEELVLENLQPHTNLEVLKIKGFSGSRFPNWMGDPSSKLTSVTLEGNGECCKVQLPVGKLQFLKHLRISKMRGLKHLNSEFCGNVKGFPLLETLDLEDLLDLDELFVVEDKYEFLCLFSLTIINCQKLRKLPDAFPALKELSIESCNGLVDLPTFLALEELRIKSCNGLVGLPSFPVLNKLSIESCNGLAVLSICPALKELSIESCNGLVDLPTFLALEELEIESCNGLVVLPTFVALQKLRIKSCNGLVVLPRLTTLCCLKLNSCSNLESLSLQAFTSLEILEICSCPKLLSFSEGWLPTTLTKLGFKNSPIKDLPEGLKNLTSLQSLRIINCDELESLPENGLPNSLFFIEITKCKFLSTRCKEGGEDWLKIAHISVKIIE